MLDELLSTFHNWIADQRPVFCAGCGRLVATKDSHLVQHVATGWVRLCPACWREYYAPYHADEMEEN